jgi:hypothetical protein
MQSQSNVFGVYKSVVELYEEKIVPVNKASKASNIKNIRNHCQPDIP